MGNSNEKQAQKPDFQPCPYEDETCTYIQSFSLQQPKEIHEFFQKYGVVVIKDVLTQEECNISKSEIFQNINEHSYNKIDQNDISTWGNVDTLTKKLGLVGGGAPVMLPQAIKNRENENIFKAYKFATGQEQFLVALERYGFMRPTHDHPEWKTVENWLHIDMNSLTGKTSTYGYQPTEVFKKASPKNPISWQNAYFQGIVALEDCPIETGGLNVVPGFQNYSETWKNQHKELMLNSANGIDPTTIPIPQDDFIYQHVQKIPIRKGSLVIWDGRVAHSNFPNTGKNPRYVQYIKMNAIGKNIVSNVEPLDYNEQFYDQKPQELSNLGKKLHGLEKW